MLRFGGFRLECCILLVSDHKAAVYYFFSRALLQSVGFRTENSVLLYSEQRAAVICWFQIRALRSVIFRAERCCNILVSDQNTAFYSGD